MHFNIDSQEFNNRAYGRTGALGNPYAMMSSQETGQAIQDAATANTSAEKKWWEILSDSLQTGAEVVSKIRPGQDTSTTAPTPQKSEIPWVPIALGGGALLTIYLLTKQKN